MAVNPPGSGYNPPDTSTHKKGRKKGRGRHPGPRAHRGGRPGRRGHPHSGAHGSAHHGAGGHPGAHHGAGGHKKKAGTGESYDKATRKHFNKFETGLLSFLTGDPATATGTTKSKRLKRIKVKGTSNPGGLLMGGHGNNSHSHTHHPAHTRPRVGSHGGSHSTTRGGRHHGTRGHKGGADHTLTEDAYYFGVNSPPDRVAISSAIPVMYTE